MGVRLSNEKWKMILRKLEEVGEEVEILWLESTDEWILCNETEIFEDGFKDEYEAEERLDDIIGMVEESKGMTGKTSDSKWEVIFENLRKTHQQLDVKRISGEDGWCICVSDEIIEDGYRTEAEARKIVNSLKGIKEKVEKRIPKRKYEGVTYITPGGEEIQIYGYEERVSKYYAKDKNRESSMYQLIPEEEIEDYLSRQDEIKASMERDKKLEKKAREKREKEKQEYEYLHGFGETLEPHHKANMLKTLNSLVSVNGKTYKRKHLVEERIADGWKPIIEKEFTIPLPKVDGERKVKRKFNTPMLKKGKTTLEVTGTEYKYGKYLIEIGYKGNK